MGNYNQRGNKESRSRGKFKDVKRNGPGKCAGAEDGEKSKAKNGDGKARKPRRTFLTSGNRNGGIESEKNSPEDHQSFPTQKKGRNDRDTEDSQRGGTVTERTSPDLSWIEPTIRFHLR